MVEFQGTWVKGQPVGKSGVAVKGYPKLQLSTSGKAPKQPKAAPVLQLSSSSGSAKSVKLDRFSEQTTTKGKAKDDSSVWRRFAWPKRRPSWPKSLRGTLRTSKAHTNEDDTHLDDGDSDDGGGDNNKEGRNNKNTNFNDHDVANFSSSAYSSATASPSSPGRRKSTGSQRTIRATTEPTRKSILKSSSNCKLEYWNERIDRGTDIHLA
jgi:hypothetical protein